MGHWGWHPFIIHARKGKLTSKDRLILLAFVFLLLANLACCHDPAPAPVKETKQPETGTGTATEAAPATEPAVQPSPTATPSPTPTEPAPCCNWLPEEFKITHYGIVLENDPYFSSREGNVPIYKGVPGQIEYEYFKVYDFIVGNAPNDPNNPAYDPNLKICDKNCVAWSVYVQGTGKRNDGRYIHTIINKSLFPSGFQQNAIYEYVDQPLSACATYLKKDETIAVSAQELNVKYFCGEKYKIEGYSSVFTITDTGSFTEEEQGHPTFDIFVGEQTHDSLYANYPDTGTTHRVARAQ